MRSRKTTIDFPFFSTEVKRIGRTHCIIIRYTEPAHDFVSNSCFRNNPRSLVRDQTDHLSRSGETGYEHSVDRNLRFATRSIPTTRRQIDICKYEQSLLKSHEFRSIIKIIVFKF